jgi:plastocyanin
MRAAPIRPARPIRTTIVKKLALSVVVTVALLVACGGQPPPDAGRGGTSAGGAVVKIDTFAFDPGTIEVSIGDEVEWTNGDDIKHTVTSGTPQEQGVPGQSENTDAQPDGLFDSELDGTDATFAFRFEDAGTFTYFCAIHPGMEGVVEVG